MSILISTDKLILHNDSLFIVKRTMSKTLVKKKEDLKDLMKIFDSNSLLQNKDHYLFCEKIEEAEEL